MNKNTILQRCRNCQGVFRVEFYPTFDSQRAFCPYCKTSHYYKEQFLQKRFNIQTESRGILTAFKESFSIRLQNWRLSPRLILSFIIFMAIFVPAAIIISFDIPSVYFNQPYSKYLAVIGESKPSLIMDRNGEILGEFFQQSKSNSSLTKDIPASLREKLLFSEDRAFYSHNGIHWKSIIRAMAMNVVKLRYHQGGSTITQQLARILLSNREKKLLRKFKEAALAKHLERVLSKDQILEAYMNQVYMGHGAYGFSQAAAFYFDKNLTDLSEAEEFILVALPSRPETLSPLRNPDLIKAKINVILSEMVKEGEELPLLIENKMDITIANLNQSPTATIYTDKTNVAPYITEHVRKFINNHFTEEWNTQGMVIRTSIDKKLQQKSQTIAESYIGEKRDVFLPSFIHNKEGAVLKKKIIKQDQYMEEMIKNHSGYSLLNTVFGIDSERLQYPRLQTAFVGVKNDSGEVLFMVGGAEFSRYNQFNRAIQMRRQTGSSIKAIVYASALEENIVDSSSHLEDSPYYAEVQNKPDWLPDNYNRIFEGSLLLRDAFVRSKNIPAVRLGDKMGLNRLQKYFSAFYFPTPELLKKRFRSDLSIVLGSLEISPLEMASSYSAFANNGVIFRPTLIQSIANAEGEEIYTKNQIDEFNLQIPAESRKVISGDVAEIMISYLHDSLKINRQTESQIDTSKLFGKTGTSNESRDVWFVGGGPGFTASVWLGFDDSSYKMKNAVGANLAKPLWERLLLSGSSYNKGSYDFEPRAMSIKLCGENVFFDDEEKAYDLEPADAKVDYCENEIRQELFRKQQVISLRKKWLENHNALSIQEDRKETYTNSGNRFQ